MNNIEYIKQQLDLIIADMTENKELYVKNPNTDFIRNRKLPFETHIKAAKKSNNEEISKGYNQIHLNAIYDLLNKVYIDAELQPKPTFDERKAFINMLGILI